MSLLSPQVLHLTLLQSLGFGQSLLKWPTSSQLRHIAFAGFLGFSHSFDICPSSLLTVSIAP